MQDDSPSSPASPTFSKPYVPAIRGQNSPFPSTPTSSHINGLFDPPPGVSYSEFIRRWTDSHVARWLADIKCANHAAAFKANDIRGDILLELDQTTLQEMGVSSIGDRLRILNAVKSLRQKSVVPRPVSTIGDIPRPTRLQNDISAETSTPQTRLTARAGRPAPLLLNNATTQSNLPRIIREQQPDSARINNPNANQQHVRPLPQPTSSFSAVSSANTTGSTPNSTQSSLASSNARNNLPPLPPPPRGVPPAPPPGRPPTRGINPSSQNTGRRTPTQDSNPPSYANQPLPPAPPNQGLLTPSSANWYGLPADPRPGNPGGGKVSVPPRATSPLPPARPRANGSGATHGRNGSVGLNSPVTSSPSKPIRGVNNSHPYANQQSNLQPPVSHRAQDLSPIQESFDRINGVSSPSPPMAFSVGRGPFNPGTPSHSNAPSLSLEALRRKLVKFLLPDEGLTYTIDVDTCAGGVEVIEKVLKKFGKGARSSDSEDAADYVQMEDGGITVDGWGVFMDDAPNEPLDEAQLLSVCHAPLDHPAREKPLILRRIGQPRRYEEKYLNAGPTAKQIKRASALSILSDLGVNNPERALESPTSATMAPPVPSKKPSKLRNFFGQRPPSELITTHLTEYFPFTEKKVLERTARHSMMMRVNTTSRRDSTASWQPPLPSRFSSSTQGSQTMTRGSSSPTRTSFSSARRLTGQFDNESMISVGDDIPRVSLSTEDGESLDLQDDDDDIPSPSVPSELAPVPFPSDSFSDAEDGAVGRRVSRVGYRSMSNASRASRRMSYMTELRSKRDISDTASLMTVDEITAEVESRRETTIQTTEQPGSDTDDWTKVDSAGSADDDTEDTYNNEEDSGPSDEEEITLNDPEVGGEGEDELAKVTMKKANKWIKGALIGAGSFGKVYLGMDAANGLLMAVKQVELPSGSASNQERKKSMLSALEREIELLQDLQHENIVQYLYSSLEDDCLNIFLEYVPGGSVTALLRSYGAFEEPLVKNFVRQILNGLQYLHERDIIHRDIKGANILVDNKGGVKISDFGISKKVDVQALSGNRAHRPSLQGSVFWMAPEVVKQSTHTFKADIWSVGCLVVEMLTGEHPWAQLTQMQAIFKIGSSAKPTIPSDISADAQDFLAQTFVLDQNARPSASDLLQHPFIGSKPKENA